MSNRIPYIDFAAGIMILWMIIYHALGQVWLYELDPYWGTTDLSLLLESARSKVLITPEGEFGCLNPCVLFPYLHFFMPIYVTHRIIMAFDYFFIVEYLKIPISSNVLLLLILMAFGILIPPLCLLMRTK